MIKLYTLIVSMFLMLGCGSYKDATKTTGSNETNSSTSASVPTPTVNANGLVEEGSYYKVSGYVSPIDIKVNATTYSDSEEFYTKELDNLTEQANAAYPGYDVTFNASLGLSDFITGMSVFLVAESNQGVASQTTVDGDGGFTFMLNGPVDTNASYTLQGTKRMAVVLTKDTTTVTWCYNLSAKANIALKNNPIILRNFTTSITKYECANPNNGIVIPAPSKPVPAAQEIATREAMIAQTAAVNNPTPTPTPTPTSTPAN